MPESRLFGRHRIRASFYHIGALLFIGISFLNYLNIVDNKAAYILTSILFIVDYVAEMYDPNPVSTGPWFDRHFHRFYKDDED